MRAGRLAVGWLSLGLAALAWGQTRPRLAAAEVGHRTVYPATAEHAGAAAWFVDVAGKAGISVRNVNGDPAVKRYIIEATGSGAGIIDYDRDGLPDIFLVNGRGLENAKASAGSSTALRSAGDEKSKGEPTNHLFHNNGDGTFTDVTAKAGVGGGGWGQGVCVGDYDNDGYDDLFVTQYGHNRLFHNERNGTFKDVSAETGVAGTGAEWGTGCAFVDYDRDGKLDLMVANYVHFDLKKTPVPGDAAGCMWKGAPVMCGPRGLPWAANILYHNVGGRFADVSEASGIRKTPGHYCFSVTTLDYDDDGWPDMYVACDSTPAILYHNNHDGTFTDVGGDSGAAYNEDGREQAGMGSTAADFLGDGHMGLFKTNFSDDTSTLYKNNGDGTFSDITFQAGLGINQDALGWGAMFADVNNDGLPDLLVVNGHVYPEVDEAKLGATFRERRFLYQNLGGGRFKDVSAASGPGMQTPLSGRGLAVADLWNDGRISAVVNNLSDVPLLLVNEAKNENHWLGVRLIGRTSTADGIGARVTLLGQSRRWVDEVRSGSSYNSSSDLRLHFGLGAETKVTGVQVRWPNGQTERFGGVDADRIVVLTEGQGVRAGS